MKKDTNRFTLRFNPSDPFEQAAIETLNTMGRNKSTLIAQALYFYKAFGGGNSDALLLHTNNTLESLIPQQTLHNAAQIALQISPQPIQAEPEPPKATTVTSDMDYAAILLQDDNHDNDDVLCCDVVNAMGMFNG